MRLKDLVTVRNIKTDRTDLPYIALENIVSWDGSFIPTEIQSEGTNARYFAGDVLFGKLRPYLAKAYIPDNDGICSTEFLVMKPKKALNNKFLEYYLLSPDFIGYIRNQVAGVKMPRTNWTEIGNLTVAFPERKEQDAIVAYLDQQINLINKRICLRERELQTLFKLKHSEINFVVTRGLNPIVPMKDSGIPWIGQIPSHWEIRRIKDVASVNARTLPDTTDKSYRFRYIDISSVSSEGHIALSDEMEFLNAPSRARRIVRRDDVIVSTVRTYLRAIAHIGWEAKDVIASTGFAVITPNEINPVYLSFLMPSATMVDEICRQSTGVSYPATTAYNIAALPIPYPPIEEQKDIAKYLSERISQIGAVVKNINEQIEKLKLLKKALLNEIITGRRTIVSI
ncbi:MAG: restriction endonuclease subunit S [Bacteroidales bacterium]|nr:restriction endonuclease subunit S [Bacteroidales bacterium]